ncbi:hypothetical protein CJU94_27125 [Paraburkholderia aromaticivorans]|uniref:Uncharacterized protein n=1 Tax=Paraburkholderia aromaticivorans TaxID=2026199 RepID=A0A248VS20_9BURK|nr:hypothetical protein CJU94_27125 [Paraburkholderia aromaticivorans]
MARSSQDAWSGVGGAVLAALHRAWGVDPAFRAEEKEGAGALADGASARRAGSPALYAAMR